jgi:SAM-dependent methyltransferase
MTGEEVLDLLEKKANKLLRGARAFVKRGDHYAEGHDWLQKYAVGHGVDIASGSFPTALADGTDTVISVDGVMTLGNMFNGFITNADRLTAIPTDSLDFVVSNYLDGMHYPMQCLIEWHRVIKPGGTIALIVANAEHDRYNSRYGPLSNPRRVNAFTKLTLKFYLERAEFKDITVEVDGHLLKAKGVK